MRNNLQNKFKLNQLKFQYILVVDIGKFNWEFPAVNNHECLPILIIPMAENWQKTCIRSISRLDFRRFLESGLRSSPEPEQRLVIEPSLLVFSKFVP